MSTDLKTLVQDWTECFNRHDADAVAAYHSEDFVFTNVGNGRSLVGREAMREDVAALFAMWSEIYIEITNLIVADDQWTKEWIMNGVHTGDIPGLPATGRPFRIAGAGVGQVRDGQIVNLTEYWNMAEFLTQVGILPPPTD